MKKLDDVFTPEVQKALTGLYVITDEHGCAPIIEAKELTADNFGLIVDDVIYTVDDFGWYSDDGRDRDFLYHSDNPHTLLESVSVPDKVRSLLDSIICVKFATRHIDNAKSMLDLVSDDDEKNAITDAFSNFDKETDDATEKLTNAQKALQICAEVWEEIDSKTSYEFDEAVDVIDDVLLEI